MGTNRKNIEHKQCYKTSVLFHERRPLRADGIVQKVTTRAAPPVHLAVFLLLARGADIGEVGDDLLGVLSFTRSGLAAEGRRGC